MQEMLQMQLSSALFLAAHDQAFTSNIRGVSPASYFNIAKKI